MTRYLLARDCEDVELAVMEGVMGFYDGIGVSTQASSYDLARVTSTPVVLLVNGKGMSLSMGSMIEGMIHFREDANIQGVILNQVSQSTYGKLKDSDCKKSARYVFSDMCRMYRTMSPATGIWD